MRAMYRLGREGWIWLFWIWNWIWIRAMYRPAFDIWEYGSWLRVSPDVYGSGRNFCKFHNYCEIRQGENRNLCSEIRFSRVLGTSGSDAVYWFLHGRSVMPPTWWTWRCTKMRSSSQKTMKKDSRESSIRGKHQYKRIRGYHDSLRDHPFFELKNSFSKWLLDHLQ